MTVNKLVDTHGGNPFIIALAAVAFVATVAWVVFRVWHYYRPRTYRTTRRGLVFKRDEWVAQIEEAAQRARGDQRTAHLLLAAEMREIVSERLGTNVTSWSSRELEQIDEVRGAGHLITSWEEPSFSLEGEGDLRRAADEGIAVIRSWS